MELDAISQPELEQIERTGGVDLVIGILGSDHQDQGCSPVAMTLEALKPLSRPLRAMVICNNGTHEASAATPESTGDSPSPIVFSFSLPTPGPGETPPQSISNAYRNILAIGGRLGVRACGVIASQCPPAIREWIYQLIQPVLDLGFDLVGPCYTRRKTEGLLNRSVLAPLHRTLYGQQLQNPMGPDFGLSGKLLQRLLAQSSTQRRGTEVNALASIASVAACDGFQVCESYLGARTQGPTDWEDLSSLLVQILGSTFLEMETRAARWQSIRGSRTLPRFGQPEAPELDTATALDVHGMIESFRLGTRNLQDVWGLLLPPTTLLELRALSRLPENQFRFPDQLWVRIVYDFALGYHLRTMSRDHVLRSITPLYLAWIASYSLEIQAAEPVEVDARIERLARAYEDSKSYLVSRWRWPDRFNP